jgi:hypothetical protein
LFRLEYQATWNDLFDNESQLENTADISQNAMIAFIDIDRETNMNYMRQTKPVDHSYWSIDIASNAFNCINALVEQRWQSSENNKWRLIRCLFCSVSNHRHRIESRSIIESDWWEYILFSSRFYFMPRLDVPINQRAVPSIDESMI